jgi:hypothetical protein
MIRLMFLMAVLTVSTFAADNCELVSVHGRVVHEVSPHAFRGVPGARVVIIRDTRTWLAVTDGRGSYSVSVPMCGTYEITAVSPGRVFEFQIFRLPVDDQTGINIDLPEVNSPCRPKRKK